MLSLKQTQQLKMYWEKNASEKFLTVQSLYRSKRYADCLFFGHLTLECILKALMVKTTKQHAPYTHNLTYLAQQTALSFTNKELQFFAKVNEFNLTTRYPDQKIQFYKICTKSYADKFYQPIISVYRHLCQKSK